MKSVVLHLTLAEVTALRDVAAMGAFDHANEMKVKTRANLTLALIKLDAALTPVEGRACPTCGSVKHDRCCASCGNPIPSRRRGKNTCTARCARALGAP